MAEITLKDIDPVATAEAARRQVGCFTTYDVANDSKMLARHARTCHARMYAALVGKQLKALAGPDGQPLLRELGKRKVGTSQTSVWELAQPGSDMPPATPVRMRPSTQGTQGLGPQCSSDSPFTARMRRHQSWVRAEVLQVPCGTGPTAHSMTPYGNFLTREDAGRGANFLTPAIFKVVRSRLAEGRGVIEPYRLLHNMLSSQPMCFNLFGPLASDLGLATRLMRALLPGEVDRVESVSLEYAPEPAADYLADRTAFDAFVAWVRPNGERAFMGIETKLTEPFSQTHYDGPSYRRWMDARAPWRSGSEGAVADRRHNQLWRDHLLAVALRRRGPKRWAHGRLALVRHPLDKSCVETVDGYRQLLLPDDDTFLDLPLDHLVKVWAPALTTQPEHAWLDAFQVRYLDLTRSAS